MGASVSARGLSLSGEGETDDGGEDKDGVAEIGDDCAQGQQEGCMGASGVLATCMCPRVTGERESAPSYFRRCFCSLFLLPEMTVCELPRVVYRGQEVSAYL